VVRGSEVNVNAGSTLDFCVSVELGAVVGSDGFEPCGMSPYELDQAVVESGDGACRELSDQHEPGEPLDECDDAVGVARTDDGVHLPVTELAALLHRCGTFGDRAFSREAAALS